MKKILDMGTKLNQELKEYIKEIYKVEVDDEIEI